jgi:hypothetical protein
MALMPSSAIQPPPSLVSDTMATMKRTTALITCSAAVKRSATKATHLFCLAHQGMPNALFSTSCTTTSIICRSLVKGIAMGQSLCLNRSHDENSRELNSQLRVQQSAASANMLSCGKRVCLCELPSTFALKGRGFFSLRVNEFTQHHKGIMYSHLSM